MAKSNIVITSTNSQGKTLQKTLTDINPAASNEQLATFGTMLNALTTNVYGGTTKITKVHCDTEAGGGESSKPIPTLQLFETGSTTVVTNFNTGRGSGNARDDQNCTLQYTGDGDLTISLPPVGCNVCFYRTPDNYLGMVTMASNSSGAQTGTFNFTIYAAETDNYQAASFDFTVTITA